MRVAAFFDLDDTIIKGNGGISCVVHQFFHGKISIYNTFLLFYRYLKYLFKRSDPIQFFKGCYIYMKGVDYTTEEKFCMEFFCKKIKLKIYKDAIRLINWHNQKGHIVIIVTNSLEIMAKPVLKYVNVKELVGSRLEVHKGLITGFTERVAYAQNKSQIIKELTKKHNIDLKKSYAYSDNSSDIPMLSMVGNPVAVNPNRKLKKFALKNNWKILKFSITLG